MDAKTMVDIRDKAWAACKGDDAERDLAGLTALVAAAKEEALEEALALIRRYLATAEKWRYDEVREALTRRIAAARSTIPTF